MFNVKLTIALVDFLICSPLASFQSTVTGFYSTVGLSVLLYNFWKVYRRICSVNAVHQSGIK